MIREKDFPQQKRHECQDLGVWTPSEKYFGATGFLRTDCVTNGDGMFRYLDVRPGRSIPEAIESLKKWSTSRHVLLSNPGGGFFRVKFFMETSNGAHRRSIA